MDFTFHYLIIMELPEFNNISLSFNYKGHIIQGNINGNLIDWVFRSNDPLFLIYFPSGKMSRQISFKPSNLDYDIFISAFYKVADRYLFFKEMG